MNGKRNRALVHLRRAAALLIVIAAALVLWRQCQSLSLRQLAQAARDIPQIAWLSAASGTLLSFACLATLEWLTVRGFLRQGVPASVALRVGASSHALANTLGFHAVTASLARYQGYRGFDLRTMDIAKILAVVGGTLIGGAVVLALMLLVWTQSNAAVAAIAVLALGLLVAISAAWWAQSSPDGAGTSRVGTLVGLVLLAAFEAAVAAATLYILLPAHPGPGYAHFALAFLAASALGVVSHSPGGAGVFEATMLAAFPHVDRSAMLASLLVYRTIYNLAPFSVAALALILTKCCRTHRSINRNVANVSSAVVGANADAPRPSFRSVVDCVRD